MENISPVILLDKPYISDLLLETIKELNVPAFLCNKDIIPNKQYTSMFISKEQLTNKLKENSLVYLNSENAISCLLDYSSNKEFTKTTQLLKNKVKFREMTKDMYPNFNFKGISIEKLANLNRKDCIFPFILKPSVGFFSMNVYKINNFDEYKNVIKNIENEREKAEFLYPKHVIDNSEFIVEEYLAGEEFAIDAYYNSEGKPIILNILKHLFSSEDDTSDRIYYTHKNIINQYLNQFTKELDKLGKIFNLKGYPVHVEFRVIDNKTIVPIEINPLRFAGWCTSELMKFAFNLNPYEYYFKQKEPSWDEIFKGRENNYYSINVADIPKSIDISDIVYVDYERFSTSFSNLLQMRKINYKEYPVFAFAFAETRNFEEMVRFLKEDLSKYLITKQQNSLESNIFT
ncbi:ATP-grasp domain-containing protein [Priestia megaterium]